jgi:hypothetical protein
MDKQWEQEVKGLSLREQWNRLYNRHVKLNNIGLWGKMKSLSKYVKLKQQMPDIFKRYNIKTFTDCGCGNFYWLNTIDWVGIKYLGIDIVERLIESNKKKYPNFEFKYMNIVDEIPPQSDMLFIRSVFIHLTNKEILMALDNIKKSGSKYLMVTTSFNVPINGDTTCLMLEKRDLSKPPFNLGTPLEVIREHDLIKPDHIYSVMGIWEVSKI